MPKATWILGAGLGVVGVGFVFAAVQSSELQTRVRDLEGRLRSVGQTAAATAGETGGDPELARQIRQLNDEVGRIHDRLKAMEGRGEPASVASAKGAESGTGGASGGTAETGSGGASSELEKLLTPESRVLLMEAVGQAMDERMKKMREGWREREQTARWDSVSKRLELNPAQAEMIQPIFAEHFKQLDVLRDKRRDAPEADRAVIDAEIAELRATTQAKVKTYMTTDQVPKLEQLFAQSQENDNRGWFRGPPGGGDPGGGTRTAPAPGTAPAR